MRGFVFPTRLPLQPFANLSITDARVTISPRGRDRRLHPEKFGPGRGGL
jgi:hypothetical protein